MSEFEDLPEWEGLLDKARVCIATGMQPGEYDNLTDAEREAFVLVVNETSSSN